MSAVNSNDGMARLGYMEGKFITKETISGPFVAHTVQLLCPASNCKDTESVILLYFLLSSLVDQAPVSRTSRKFSGDINNNNNNNNNNYNNNN